MSVQCESFVFS
uniref:Uncharacterized protein n=1 Tax=Anopheles quadriannulatus TaxID=34691 RepID=A0A182XS41_ANOQN